MQHVFIIGAKGIPAKYGGFETFVDKLTEKKQNKQIMYHVASITDRKPKEYLYNGAHCFEIKVPPIGPAKAVYYDIQAFRYALEYIHRHSINNAVVYVLACRIGPFVGLLKKKLKLLGGYLYVNPDGHEWKRDKWNSIIKLYWKISERYMIKHAELIICDSKNIEKYIQRMYSCFHPKTTYIAYGAEVRDSSLHDADKKLCEWIGKNDIRQGEYYLVVGRFVPENNYEVMIMEFMRSHTEKDLVLITNIEQNKFYEELKLKTGFDKDKRIKFVGTVYDQELLKKIREMAYGYIHGHEVGGTNPSLLEALASTRLNLLLKVGFNKEVGEHGAFYWNKKHGSLAKLIDRVEKCSEEELEEYGKRAKARVSNNFSWEKIVQDYENIFMEAKNE